MNKERLVYMLFALSTGIPTVIVILSLILGFLQGGQESSVFYTPAIILGMIIFPIALLATFALIMASTVFAFIYHTKNTLLLGIMGLFLLLSPLLTSFDIVSASLYELNNWPGILLYITFITSASMYYNVVKAKKW